MDTRPDTPALSDKQREFAAQRIAWLDHAIRLIKLGKPGAAQLRKELAAERDSIQRHLIADNLRGLAEKGGANG